MSNSSAGSLSPRQIVLPGAWAMGDGGIVLDAEDGEAWLSSVAAVPLADSEERVGGGFSLRSFAGSFSSAVGGYLNDIASLCWVFDANASEAGAREHVSANHTPTSSRKLPSGACRHGYCGHGKKYD
ncbi:hypothetical protein GPECTOR_25g377 [Gonium pectorale]|uniref:Uncharacterized protein n=1 Tax=Gonium pectorale TaxID=33097 RepID=A0A150GG78_GONPE|nr:hypothetical protein GPECTOR_25g377 [Gonium pectorale]|eukprot:KXZ48793.1 hypothetical protein GPECTOR_25g377 [Gonium pectorale]